MLLSCDAHARCPAPHGPVVGVKVEGQKSERAELEEGFHGYWVDELFLTEIQGFYQVKT